MVLPERAGPVRGGQPEGGGAAQAKPKPEPEDSDDKDKDEDKEEPKEEEQEQPEVRQVDCDSAIGVPAILDWAPPPVPSEPAPPADPRPENRR